MKTYQTQKILSGFRRDESGGIALIVAVLLVALLSAAALAIDYGHMSNVQYDLRKAADAGALAGARGLWPLDLSAAGSRDPDCAAAATWALTTATSNKADGVNLAPSEVTVEVGRWDYATQQFIPEISLNANGVRVTTQRTNVQTYFARVFGFFSKDLSGTATAIMDFAGSIGAGALPIAINKMYAKDPNGNPLTIILGPSPSDNGGWFIKTPDSVCSSSLGDYINNGACPALHMNDSINLGNGEYTTCISDLSNKLDAQISSPSSPKALYTLLPVVDTNSFNHAERIIGFVPFKITVVNSHANPKYITGIVLDLGQWESAQPGGGGKFGALSPPKMVQ